MAESSHRAVAQSVAFALNAPVTLADTTYRGTAMEQGAGGRTVSGRLTLDSGQLRFDSAVVSVAMPLVGLQLRAGGHNDEQLFFEHAAQPNWLLTCSEHAILGPLAAVADPALQEQVRLVKRRQASVASRFMLATLVVLLVLVGAVALLLSQKSRLARAAARHV